MIQEHSEMSHGMNCRAQVGIMFLNTHLKQLMKGIERCSRHSEGALEVAIGE